MADRRSSSDQRGHSNPQLFPNPRLSTSSLSQSSDPSIFKQPPVRTKQISSQPPSRDSSSTNLSNSRPESSYSLSSSPDPSRPHSRHSSAPQQKSSPISISTIFNHIIELYAKTIQIFYSLSFIQRILAFLLGVICLVLGILFLIYHRKILTWLLPIAIKWRESKGGWILLFVLVVVVSFPPLVGYGLLYTLGGAVFGFWKGWAIIASATIVGSTASFIVSRYFLQDFVTKLTSRDKRFQALALTLKHDGLKLLVMIRLCPLPYSLSNGALSTIPTVTPIQMLLSTAIATPKLFIGTFIGSRLGKLAEEDQMDLGAKILSYISIGIGLSVGLGTGYFMYTKTQKRAAELEELERRESPMLVGSRQNSTRPTRDNHNDDDGFDEADIDIERGLPPLEFGYMDSPLKKKDQTKLLSPNKDDISLHTTTNNNNFSSIYRDESDSNDDGNNNNLAIKKIDGKNLDDVFAPGDGDEDTDDEDTKNKYRIRT